VIFISIICARVIATVPAKPAIKPFPIASPALASGEKILN
jgi:hypothetical protein